MASPMKTMTWASDSGEFSPKAWIRKPTHAEPTIPEIETLSGVSRGPDELGDSGPGTREELLRGDPLPDIRHLRKCDRDNLGQSWRDSSPKHCAEGLGNVLREQGAVFFKMHGGSQCNQLHATSQPPLCLVPSERSYPRALVRPDDRGFVDRPSENLAEHRGAGLEARGRDLHLSVEVPE